MTAENRSTAPAPHGIRASFRRLSGTLRRALLTLRHPLGGGSTERGWGTAIEQVVNDLENLNRSTERDFLAVGEKLIEFRSVARQIVSDMAALTELISGEQGRNASQALTSMLEHSRGMDARIEQSGQALGQVHELSCRIRLAFAGLPNTVSVFRTLCTLTRIETSRLGSIGADFGDLAAEVRPMSESIQSSGEGVLKAASRLDEGVQSAMRSGSELRARQLKELPALISGVIGSLHSFDERRQRAAEASAHQAARYGALCGAVENVVSSVQFHDITRQQIEHVVQALRQLRSGCESGRGRPGSLPPGARSILALESSQLSAAAGVFASSLASMERDLESIAVRVQDMAEASRALMGISESDKDSFFLRMEGDFTAILKMLDTCTAAQAEMGSTAANLAETIGRMRESVAGIRGIEIRIQRIATNATIRAAHIGAAGNALNVIAEVMQRLALDSNANTEDVAGALDTMSDAASRVSGGRADAASGAEASTDGVTGEMRDAVGELHSLSESSFARVNQIAGLGARLAGELGAVRGGLSAGPLFARVVDRARGELERIAAQAGEGALEGVEAAPARQLASLAQHYTMQRERDVHESVARRAALPVVPTEASRTALAEGDLGDNVELF
jgi:methyl-accepting chemotaxis protein